MIEYLLKKESTLKSKPWHLLRVLTLSYVKYSIPG